MKGQGFFLVFGDWKKTKKNKKCGGWWVRQEDIIVTRKPMIFVAMFVDRYLFFVFLLSMFGVFFLNYGGTMFDLFVSVKVSVFLVFEFCDWVLVLWVCLFDSWGNMEKRVDLGSLGSAWGWRTKTLYFGSVLHAIIFVLFKFGFVFFFGIKGSYPTFFFCIC